MYRLFLCIVATVVGIGPVCAQVPLPTVRPSVTAKSEPLSTDRPDFVESSNTVGLGRFQIETSLGFERATLAGSTSRTASTPTLFRYGISPAWELRVETDGITSLRATSGNASGLSDTAIGAKWHTQDADGSHPSVGWLFHVDLPNGSSAFRGQGARPSVRAVFEWELPKDYSLGVMPGISWNQTPESGHFTSGIFAVVAGKSFTERLRGFVEYSGQEITSAQNGGNVSTFDVGAAFLLNHNLQVDTVANWGLTRSTPRFTIGVGLSARY